MAAAVVVERDGQGRLVVRKTPVAAEGAPAAGLRAEADWLRRAAGPGVAVLFDDGPSGDGVTTAHAGAHTWRTGSIGPADAGEVAAGLLRTVDRLHRQGLVHGAIGPDHIVLGADGPVLCSPRPGSDDPTEDRLALAELFDDAVQRWVAAGLTVPDRAGWGKAVELLRRPASGWALADIAALVEPGPAHPATGAPHRRSAGHRRAVVVATLVTVGLGLTWIATLAGLPTSRPAPPVADRAPGGSIEAPSPAVEPGGAGRYRTDRASGVLATTAHPCPGTPPAAVLQPGTGEVWAFSALPAHGRQVRGVAVQRVPGADRLEARPAGDCQRIVALGPAGEASVPAVPAGG